MDVIRRTLDLEDQLDTINEQIESFREAQEELVDTSEEMRPLDTQEDIMDHQLVEAKHDMLDSEITNLRGYANAIERALDEWDGSEVVIKELTAYETRMMRDTIKREAAQVGIDTEESYPSGKHEIEFMQRAIESTPPGAPDPEEIQGVPETLFDFLLNRANAVNSVGELTLGNSSLNQKVAERTGRT